MTVTTPCTSSFSSGVMGIGLKEGLSAWSTSNFLVRTSRRTVYSPLTAATTIIPLCGFTERSAINKAPSGICALIMLSPSMRKQKVVAADESVSAGIAVSARRWSVTCAGNLIKKSIWLPHKLTKEISIFVLSYLAIHLPSLIDNHRKFFFIKRKLLTGTGFTL